MLWFVVIKGVFVNLLLLMLLLLGFLSIFYGLPGGASVRVLLVIRVLGWLLTRELQLFQHLYEQGLLT